jgi:hypothetical protein
VARQARSKAQAQWLAESTLDRARLHRPSAGQPAETWSPDPEGSSFAAQQATAQLETDQSGVTTLVIVARVGRDGSPTAAQHVIRETLPGETEP